MTPSLLANYQCNRIMKKKNITSVLGVIGLAGLVGASSLNAQAPAPGVPPVAPAGPKPTADEMKMVSSYFFGFQQGSGLHGAGFKAEEFSTEELVKGFLAGMSGAKMDVPEAKIQAVMTAMQAVAKEREAAKAKVKLAEGTAFLEKNGKREGVITTKSGLQYEVINKGAGKTYVAPAGEGPDQGTKFMVRYKGTLLDGEEFDSSIKHNPDDSPAEFGLTVVPGFAEALKMMPTGSKWKLFLNPALGYGASPRGPGGPNSVLTFELELVEIKAAPVGVAAPPVPGLRPSPRASAVTPPVQVPAPPAPPAAKKSEKAE